VQLLEYAAYLADAFALDPSDRTLLRAYMASASACVVTVERLQCNHSLTHSLTHRRSPPQSFAATSSVAAAYHCAAAF
jgi:hypothetical protein